MNNQVPYLAIAGDVNHYGLLPDRAVELWRELAKSLNEKWRGGDAAAKRQAAQLHGCLEKLSSSLLVVSRLRAHHDNLIAHGRQIAPIPGSYLAVQGADACTDFEGLLLHGRAALDRLAWFISSDYGNRCNSFARLPNVLSNFARDGNDAARLLEVIAKSEAWFDGVFGQLEVPKSLRDLVAHNQSLTEGIQTCFAINCLAPARFLFLDCEVQFPSTNRAIPVLRTTEKSTTHLSYVVLNCVAIQLQIHTIDLENCTSQWVSSAAVLSEFAIQGPAGSPLGPHTLITVRRMTLDGADLTVQNVNPALFEKAVQF